MKVKIVAACAFFALAVPAAALSDAPPGATALCVDGTYSFSATRSGTCSHHGGVAVWLTPTTPVPVPAPPPAPPPPVVPPAGTAPLIPRGGSISGFVSPLNLAEYDAY